MSQTPPGDARCAGVVLHPTSLPGRGARGTIGAEARRFVDWLAAAGFGLWQVLPLGPTHGDLSPYQCQSVFAADPALIDREEPVRAGWLPAPRWDLSVRDWLGYARTHWQRSGRVVEPLAESAETAFLQEFARFRAARARFDEAPWWEWPAGLRDRDPQTLATFSEHAAQGMADELFGQRLFATQWQRLREYAARCGVQLMGDAPIFVALDSAEVWCRRDLFLLNASGAPDVVAGVPPDYFSATGQRWGNPLYNWDAMAQDGFSWWLARLSADLDRVDCLRLDHFRGLESYWAIPSDCDTALTGEWRTAPGDAFLQAVRDRFGRIPLIAEDLGIITPAVNALRERFELPGMKVLQFAFGGDADNPYLPHLHTADCVVYTGTHDNDTTVGWVQTSSDEVVQHACAYFDCVPFGLANAMLRAAYQSVARVCMVPFQDLLWLDGAHRMNVPGEPDGNWRWRFSWDMVPPERACELRSLAELSGRAAAGSGPVSAPAGATDVAPAELRQPLGAVF
ncbi:MAG: 4-alpha-glucanotransferase [Pseudomonadota bacterium]